MGGSSLCVEVLKLTFGRIAGYPEVLVLDSTDPAQIKALESKLDLAKTIFIVSSKSGSTLEPNIFKQYFFERVKQVVGAAEAGKHFIAVTDPGSQHAESGRGQRLPAHLLRSCRPSAGRYSALSDFGAIPGAIQGIDIGKFFDRTEKMVRACSASVPADQNPGVILGATLGTLAKSGRDKITIFTSPGISDLGAWLEQLIAESTGKEGHGIIPVDRERIGSPEVYGNDRVFAYLRLESEPDAKQDCCRGGARKGRPARRAHRRAGNLRPGPGIFPLGDRHGRCRLGDRHQHVQPARRRSEQDRNAQA